MLHYCKVSQDLKLLHIVILYRNKIPFNTLLTPEPTCSQVCIDLILLHPFHLFSYAKSPTTTFLCFSKCNDQIFPSPILMSYTSGYLYSGRKKKLICKSIGKLSLVRLKTVFLSHQASFTLPLPYAL